MTERRRLEQAVRRSLTAEACPPSEQLADYILGSLERNDQLRVAAHVRTCPLCAELIAIATPEVRKERPLLARLLPVALQGGLRSDVSRGDLRQYVAADVVIELRVGPTVAGRWTITGQVLRQGEGLPACQVLLQPARRRGRSEVTDVDGFFSFGNLSDGMYRVTVSHANVQVAINDLDLRGDDQ